MLGAGLRQRLTGGVEVVHRRQGHGAGQPEVVGKQERGLFPFEIQHGYGAPLWSELHPARLPHTLGVGLGLYHALPVAAELSGNGLTPLPVDRQPQSGRYGMARTIIVHDLAGLAVVGQDLVGEIGIEGVEVDTPLPFPERVDVVEIEGQVLRALGFESRGHFDAALAGNEGMIFGE